MLLGYTGQLDALIIWLAKLRGIPFGTYSCLCTSRLSRTESYSILGLSARLIYAWEWLAFRAAPDHEQPVLGETPTDPIRSTTNQTAAIFIGAELEHFTQRAVNHQNRSSDAPIEVLFYGTFIPLHGVRTIIEAAQLLHSHPISWTLIGTGQEAQNIDALESNLCFITRIEWVPYGD